VDFGRRSGTPSGSFSSPLAGGSPYAREVIPPREFPVFDPQSLDSRGRFSFHDLNPARPQTDRTNRHEQ